MSPQELFDALLPEEREFLLDSANRRCSDCGHLTDFHDHEYGLCAVTSCQHPSCS